MRARGQYLDYTKAIEGQWAAEAASLTGFILRSGDDEFVVGRETDRVDVFGVGAGNREDRLQLLCSSRFRFTAGSQLGRDLPRL